MKKQPAKQYVIYSRKSKFTGKGESIENQIELCRQYIASHYGAEQAENALVYEDATVIIGLKQNPTYGRRFSPIFLFIRAFCGAKRKMLL